MKSCGMPHRLHVGCQIIAVFSGTFSRAAATNRAVHTFVFFKEFGMRVLLTIAAAGSVVVTGAVAAAAGLAIAGSAIAMAAERPSFEVKSFPISPVQVQLLGAAGVKEQPSAPTSTVAGMPASPAQIAVLTPRPQRVASAR
jgi:hypothetical protein